MMSITPLEIELISKSNIAHKKSFTADDIFLLSKIDSRKFRLPLSYRTSCLVSSYVRMTYALIPQTMNANAMIEDIIDTKRKETIKISIRLFFSRLLLLAF